jgi:hypothetical protein
MKLIIEALFVGLYTIFIYFIIYFIESYTCLCHNYLYMIFFIVGFCKHWFGYYTGIQSYYCNTVNNSHTSYNVALPRNLLLYSIIEGFVFIFIATILHFFIKSIWISLLFTGIIIHLLAEIIGVHKYFIKYSCVNKL